MLRKKPLSLVLSSLMLLGVMGTTTLSANPAKKSQSKPFLIQGKLPHYAMMLKMMWDDKDLNLTPKQKEKLLKIRKETVSKAKELNKKIIALENKIVKESKTGAKPASMKGDVYKLAKLRANATMIHLKCIYNTRKILTQDQLDILD
jgi:Spy/CpxP family protein refolding chaperone